MQKPSRIRKGRVTKPINNIKKAGSLRAGSSKKEGWR
jgi:hypothetical protein